MSRIEQNLREFLKKYTTYDPETVIFNKTHYKNKYGKWIRRENAEDIMLAMYTDLRDRYDLYLVQIRNYLLNHPEKQHLVTKDIYKMKYNELAELRKTLKIRGNKIEKIQPAPAKTVEQAKEALGKQTQAETAVRVIKSNQEHSPYEMDENGQYFMNFAAWLNDDEPEDEREEFLEADEYASVTGDVDNTTQRNGSYVNLGYEPGTKPITQEEIYDDIETVMQILETGLPEYQGEPVTLEYLTTISRGKLADVYLASRAYKQTHKKSGRSK